MYVKDLEMKSRYLEGECRKLGRLLQCVLAENQALRFSLQPGNAHGASLAKQESAVLLLGMNHELSFSCFLVVLSTFHCSSLNRVVLFNISHEEMEKRGHSFR